MKRNRKRYALAALLALIVATASFAFAASNTVAASNAGLGDGVVSGYTVSAVSWDLLDTDPTQIDDFSFSTAPAIGTGEVRVALDLGAGFVWLPAGDCSAVAAVVTCNPTGAVGTLALVGIRVAAAS